MKDAPLALIDHLATARVLRPVDLIAIKLTTGVTHRFACTDLTTVKADGFDWAGGAPTFRRSGTRRTLGIEVPVMTLTINFRPGSLLGSVPWSNVLRLGALDGALVSVRRGYWSDWSLPAIGTLHVFDGTVGDVSGGAPTLTLSLRGETDLFNVAVPRTTYQAGCRNTLYDASTCKVARQDINCTALSGSTRSRIAASGLTQADGWFTAGLMRGVTGANAGAVRGVKQHAGGALLVSEPWPETPAVGDAFLVAAGCDHTRSTCQSKFNNLANFRGEPHTPTPETAL